MEDPNSLGTSLSIIINRRQHVRKRACRHLVKPMEWWMPMVREGNRHITRRSFVQKSGAAAGAAWLTSMSGATSIAAQSQSRQPPDEEIDVAVVGAGISGVYCAWRLLQDDPSRTIVVFDAADHVGWNCFRPVARHGVGCRTCRNGEPITSFSPVR